MQHDQHVIAWRRKRSDYYGWICDFAKILGHPVEAAR
jgi:hypothetical protein